jgi:hypothetical protein
VAGLTSCNNQTTEKTVDKNSNDSIQVASADKKQTGIFVKDKSQYDQAFIDGLADYNEPIKLIDNYIITGVDTTYFPNDLNLNTATIFKAIKDDSKYLLTVTRINLTSLTYSFQLTDKDNQTIDTKSGKAILFSTFFLAPEGDVDTESSGYGSQEYWDKANDCWVSIRIGIGVDNNGKKRAKVTFGCEDKSKQTLELDDFPVMRTE